MRLKTEKNEVCSFATGGEGMYTWMIKDLYGSSPSVMKTEEFEVEGHKWQLQIHPRGKEPDSKNVAFLVHSCNQSVSRARVHLSILNNKIREKTISNDFDHTFFRGSTECGCNAFLETAHLKDETLGFQSKGWITLTAQILVEDPDETYGHPPQGSFANPSPNVDQILRKINSGQLDPTSDAFRAEMTYLAECVERSMSLQQQDSVLTLDSCAQTAPSGLSSAVIEDGRHSHSSPFRLAALKPGVKFTGRYLIEDKKIEGQSTIRFASDVLDEKQLVVLKFYPSKQAYEKSFKLHKLLSDQYLCKVTDCITDDRPGSYPPCLVFERGSYTLDEWMRTGTTDLSERKDAMFQVLECLKHIHSCNLVHGDVKPDNIACFPSTRSWKFLNADGALAQGKQCSCVNGHTLEYIAPERIEAEENRQTTIAADKSMDMWAFGLLAFELLTKRRFYGLCPNIDTMKNRLFDACESTYLESVDDERTKEWLRHFLCLNPKMRWTAQAALDHATFTPIGHTTETADGFREVANGCLIKERTEIKDCEYKVTVKKLNNLQKGEDIESKVFEAGGRRWKVGLLICDNQTNTFDVVKILLISCNGLRVRAHVTLNVKFGEKVDTHEENACADLYGAIKHTEIEVNQLKKSQELPPDQELVITVKLRHIVAELDVEKIKSDCNTVNVEVIDRETIKDWLNGRRAFRLAPPDRKKTAEVAGSGLIRHWADRCPDRRYWLCNRSDTGFVSVEKYLNETDMLVDFNEISTQVGGGFPWVTVFKEEKNSSDSFGEVPSDSIIVFCKLFAYPYKDLTYLGHLIVEKRMPCQTLLAKIAYELARFSDSAKFNAYMERDKNCIVDITKSLKDLPAILIEKKLEHKDEVGYIVILRKRERNEAEGELDAVQQGLQEIHEKASKKEQTRNVGNSDSSAPNASNEGSGPSNGNSAGDGSDRP